VATIAATRAATKRQQVSAVETSRRPVAAQDGGIAEAVLESRRQCLVLARRLS